MNIFTKWRKRAQKILDDSVGPLGVSGDFGTLQSSAHVGGHAAISDPLASSILSLEISKAEMEELYDQEFRQQMRGMND